MLENRTKSLGCEGILVTFRMFIGGKCILFKDIEQSRLIRIITPEQIIRQRDDMDIGNDTGIECNDIREQVDLRFGGIVLGGEDMSEQFSQNASIKDITSVNCRIIIERNGRFFFDDIWLNPPAFLEEPYEKDPNHEMQQRILSHFIVQDLFVTDDGRIVQCFVIPLINKMYEFFHHNVVLCARRNKA